jgi:hypothetical protein
LYRSNKALIDFYSLEVVSPTLTTIETGNITSNVIDGTTGSDLLYSKSFSFK